MGEAEFYALGKLVASLLFVKWLGHWLFCRIVGCATSGGVFVTHDGVVHMYPQQVDQVAVCVLDLEGVAFTTRKTGSDRDQI